MLSLILSNEIQKQEAPVNDGGWPCLFLPLWFTKTYERVFLLFLQFGQPKIEKAIQKANNGGFSPNGLRDVAAVCLVVKEEVWKVKHMAKKVARCNLTCTDQEGNICTKTSGDL